MKALVTGADGFIGSHLTEMLLHNGYDVRALTYYNSFNNWGHLEGLSHPGLEIVSGDVRDPNLCQELVAGTDLVFHLAALIAIPYSYTAPDSYVDTNVRGTLNICNAVRRCGGPRLLVTSTSEVYGTGLYVPMDEKHPRQAQSPYSASKIGADAMAMSFYNAFELPVTIVRPFNTYGPRQSARAIIPTIITQIASGMKEIKVGDLSPTRDLTYVEDTCKGFLAIAREPKTIGEEVNISTNFEVSMRDLFELIAKVMGADVRYVEDNARIRPGKSEVFRLWGDNTKLRSMTGFAPDCTLEEGLTRTVEWFSNPRHLSNYKAGIYNV